MGIPRFFRYISNQFPDIYNHISFKNGFYTNQNEQQIDNLYLDANGILHNCARDVYFPKYRKKSNISKELQLFEAIGEYINQLLLFVKPKSLFYIAIDGPAPLAKQAQQRQRRYRSVDSKTPEELAIFDSVAITPGTQFMSKLSKFMRYYIRKKITERDEWKGIKVIFSGPEVPGEGEHKIVDFIRNNPSSKGLTHCMYGLDADLFMLSLGTHCSNFYLLREDQFTTSWTDTFFYKVNIGLLREKMYELWGNNSGNMENLINDFIFICFLVGNDFLHALPVCHELEQSIDLLMNIHKLYLGSKYITNNDNTPFNINHLKILFEYLEKIEEANISGQFYKSSFENITLTSSLKTTNRPDLGIDIKKYRTLYYEKVGLNPDNSDHIYDFCKQYLQGLEWVNNYYHSKPKNWEWFFPFHYSPLVLDLLEYINNPNPKHSLVLVSNTQTICILPFQQLLCVLPPKSKKLIPKYLQDVFEYENMKGYYPEKYKIDYEGKNKEWEGIAILPFIDFKDIVDSYNKATMIAKEKGIEVEYPHNNFGSNVEFYYTPGIKYDYKSNYGVITNCNVKYRNF